MIIEQIPQTTITEFRIKRVVAYARVSSDKGAAEHSLEAQIDYYKDYITEKPDWIYAGMYADNGISGTKDNRPDFQRMMADARAGKFDLIVTKSVTRFARNIVTLLDATRKLKALGINVLFEKEDMYADSADGELLLSLLAMYAEEEARSASENKRWQIQKYFEAGRPTYFRIYGYKWVDEHLEVIPKEAEIVRRIFREYLSGMGKEVIARNLNKDGIPSLTSKWRPSTIHEMLRNEKYTGSMLLQKKITPDFRTKKQKKNRGEARQYLVENCHEPIIVKEIFDAVQREIIARQAQNDGANERRVDSPFYGLVRCAQCGKLYRCKNQREKSSNTYFLVWRCSTFMDIGKTYCSAKQIRESILIDKTKQVLGIDKNAELTREMILAHIDSIESAADNKLRFFLKNGKVEIVPWENPSRSKSWTPEMRERARQKSLEIAKRRKEGNHEHDV